MNSFRLIDLPVKPEILRPQIIHFEELDSTNAYLLSRHPHPSGSIVWADFQSAGRGRLGRSWVSPRDEALLFSIFLKNNNQIAPLFIYPFLTAVGVLEALQNLVAPAWLAVKWPNDVLLKNLKVGGILVQSKTRASNNTNIVIGIGVNVNQNAAFFNANLPFAGSLFSIIGKKFERFAVLTEIVSALDRNLQDLQVNGPQAIMQKWRDHCPFFGQAIRVDDGRQVYSGKFQDITADGGLILQTGQTRQIFHAADVTVVKER
ncbi:MAG: biotin--[acetyl-CoA-carboxylase] ligase [Candidatus Neomarinimicrobiota bacterium]